MSSNDNRPNSNNTNNNTNRNRSSDASHIRGPTSALSSFLREHGIRVHNRSRIERQRERQQREQQEQQASNPPTPNATSTPSTPSGSAATSDTTEATLSSTAGTASETILYTPVRTTRRTRSAREQNIMDAASTSSSNSSSRSQATKKKKKRPLSDDDDNDGDDNSGNDDNFIPGPSRLRSTSGRTRVLFCSKCKGRYVRDSSDTSNETMCPNCLSGKSSAGKNTKKRRIINHGPGGNKDPFIMQRKDFTPVVSSLQDICINVVTDHIDDVEALGDISFINMDKIAKIICRNRKLTNQVARLFMEPRIRELCLYDCTNVDVDGLKNIAHFCPNLQTLRLYYVGRMNDDVIDLYGSRLQNLTSLTLSGCHLITEEQWIRFFETVGGRLKEFSLRHSNRFKKESLKALVDNCTEVKCLRFSRIVTLSNEWVEILLESGLDTLENLELSWPSNEPGRRDLLTDDHLIKLLAQTGSTLKELSLRGCKDLTDALLMDGIKPHCPLLQKLVLEECADITSDGFTTLFSDSWKVGPPGVKHVPGMGLEHVVLARCLQFDDSALQALLAHSWKTIKHLNINSLDKLSVASLELIAGENTDDVTDRFSTESRHESNKSAVAITIPTAENTDTSSTTAATVSSAHNACQSLTHLDACFVRSMDDYVMTKLIRSCSSLQYIKVWGCHQVTDLVTVPPKLTIEGREFF